MDAVLAPLWRSEGAICLLDDRFPTVVSCMTSLRTLTEVDDSYQQLEDIEERLSEHRSPRHHVIRALQARSTGEVASILSADPVTAHGGRVGEALAIYARLRAEALAVTLPPEAGYVTDFLDLVHADLRQPLRSILAQHFPPTSEPEFRAMSKRARALAAWIGEPLHADRRKRSWGRGG